MPPMPHDVTPALVFPPTATIRLPELSNTMPFGAWSWFDTGSPVTIGITVPKLGPSSTEICPE